MVLSGLQWSRANDGAETHLSGGIAALWSCFNGAAPMMARKLLLRWATPIH